MSHAKKTTKKDQTLSSQGTTRNIIPRTYAFVKDAVGWQGGSLNLDLGCGKYTKFHERLLSHGVKNFRHDPYHFPNESVLLPQRYDTITINNVLNVLDHEASQKAVLQTAKLCLKPEGICYVLVYEGNKSGVAKIHGDNFQSNKKASSYELIINEVFSFWKRKGSIFLCSKQSLSKGAT